MYWLNTRIIYYSYFNHSNGVRCVLSVVRCHDLAWLTTVYGPRTIDPHPLALSLIPCLSMPFHDGIHHRQELLVRESFQLKGAADTGRHA